MRNAAAFICVVLSVFLALAAGCGCAAGGPESPAVLGSMRICVKDGMSDAPIDGARVVFPEEGLSFRTGADGLTERVSLPCRPDGRNEELSPLGEGRTTVIVYAEGYVPYLLLYARVLPGRERETPTVYMFPDDGSLPVFEVIEAPPLEWAEEVVKRFAP